jgi:hypothetical protein
MTCWKKTFATKGEATAYKFGHDTPLRPYRCPYCHQWHMTSEKQSVKPEERVKRREPYKRKRVWDAVREAEAME